MIVPAKEPDRRSQHPETGLFDAGRSLSQILGKS